MKFIQISGRIELPHTKLRRRDLYELYTSYLRRTLLFTGILCKRIQLSKNSRNDGSEFANWQTVEKELNCCMYFADPYCAWQKGTNENLDGLLREFYTKDRNLSRVSPATLKKNLALINARPKKVLGLQKPIDLFEDSIKKCCTKFRNSP